MKVNFREHLRRESILDHLVLHCLGAAANEVAEDPDYVEKGELDIQLLVNGHELPIEKFVEHWQSQVGRMIKEAAEEKIQQKFCEIDEVFDTVRNILHNRLNITDEEREEFEY